MRNSKAQLCAIAFVATGLAGANVRSAELASLDTLNAAAIKILTPDQFVWRDNIGAPANQTVLHGDPAGPGFYAYINRFQPGNFSMPHYHANDRYITVLEGTWWVGTGTMFDPESTVPVPKGSFVTHYGNEVHYDGAKDEEVVLLIVGQGPAPGVPVEQTN